MDLTPVNDAPTLSAGTIFAIEDGPAVTLDLSTLGDDVDSDNDGTDLTYNLAVLPNEGTVKIDGATLSFDPGRGFQYLAARETKDVVVQITATDQHGLSVAEDVTITVTGRYDAPPRSGTTKYLSDGDDTQTGTEGDDLIRGEGGNDILSGGAGNDYLHGGDGDDEIWAGPGDAGNDRLFGGAGNDRMGV